MINICVLIEDTIDSYKVINNIENSFMCFTKFKMVENGFLEVSFLCRQEDAGAIEKRLADIV